MCIRFFSSFPLFPKGNDLQTPPVWIYFSRFRRFFSFDTHEKADDDLRKHRATLATMVYDEFSLFNYIYNYRFPSQICYVTILTEKLYHTINTTHPISQSTLLHQCDFPSRPAEASPSPLRPLQRFSRSFKKYTVTVFHTLVTHTNTPTRLMQFAIIRIYYYVVMCVEKTFLIQTI